MNWEETREAGKKDLRICFSDKISCEEEISVGNSRTPGSLGETEREEREAQLFF